MNILITGGAGFIGSATANMLWKLGHQVCVVDNLSTGQLSNLNPEIPSFITDIRSFPIKDTDKFDVIYHFAAQTNLRTSIADPIIDAENNILNTLQMLQFAKKAKLIFSSTGAVYGETEVPATELTLLGPRSPYGISKWSCEQYIKLLANNYVILRYSNVYGPNQNPRNESGVIAIFLDAIRNKQSISIYGDGNQQRDFIYIDDVVWANVAALNFTGTHNISTGVGTSINDLANLLNIKADYKSSIAGELNKSILTPSKNLGTWSPQVDILQGLKKISDHMTVS